jgi:pyruvate/2-oxoglutarate dehydrogenase complex dihydrolipoamide acyltransferase (E2) component
MLAGRGVVVVVHGDLRTTYEPLAPSVRVGDAVDAGAVIGRLAEGGHCPGCLHWGLLRGDVYLDPVQLVRRGPSRLLPVPAAVDPAGSATAGRAAPPPAGSPAALEPAAEPRLSLRAAQAPWSAAALVALLAGLALLVRPSRRPPSPPAAPAVTAPAAATSAGAPMVAAPRCELVDFARERSRRRIA